MVQVNIENTPVSEQTSGGSISVPTGEIWHVTITVAVSDPGDGTFNEGEVRLNGNAMAAISFDANISDSVAKGHLQKKVEDIVLVGGDTINANNRNGSGTEVTVQGYKIN